MLKHCQFSELDKIENFFFVIIKVTQHLILFIPANIATKGLNNKTIVMST